jgi:hypothetical protein
VKFPRRLFSVEALLPLLSQEMIDFILQTMNVELVTKEDLQTLRFQIVGDIKDLLDYRVMPGEGDIRGYRTREVRHMLGCSLGKVKSLCTGGRIRTKKIGGTIYYNTDDVKRLLTSGF